MLVTRQPLLRKFWYPVVPLSMLENGPVPFTLLGTRIAIWRGENGEVSAVRDRCCHRTAALSLGFLSGNNIACGYHGWEYDGSGKCVKIPQQDRPEDVPDHVRVDAYRVAVRYDYVWVALDEPLTGIPDFPEAEDPEYRIVPEFYEVWNAAGLRVMENSFDNAHFSYVHKASFGNDDDPTPADLSIDETDHGFVMKSVIPVKNPEMQKELLGMDSDRTERHITKTWFMPFAREMRIDYPNGLVHCIVTVATPIDDSSSQIVQFAMRNDTEEDAPAEKVRAFDRQVTSEDRAILEGTDPDVMLDVQSFREAHMRSDRPGLLMRKMLRKALADRGETEALREPHAATNVAAE